MPTLRRLRRPSDRRMGLVYGEDPRPRMGTGSDEGYTLVTVQGPQAVRQLVADGWAQVGSVQPPGPVEVRDTRAQPVPSPDPNMEHVSATQPPADPQAEEVVQKRGRRVTTLC